jgi:glyoxylase-like metal-dependent hydrolase (beta-lactamase superfamily II)
MAKGFASTADLGEKTITFAELGEGLYAFTTEGDPNSGVIVGSDGCIVIDAQATPAMAGKVIDKVRTVTDKPVKYVVLTHYHAVRVLGASAYHAQEVIASDLTRGLIVERGQQDWDSEYGRFPRLFRGADSIPGLTWPTMTFEKQMSLWLGDREVRLMHLGRGHTMGDIVAWVPDAKVMYAGDLVEYGATPYCGDAHFTDWPATLDRLAEFGAHRLVPGRGEALTSPEMVAEGIAGTRGFLAALYGRVQDHVAQGHELKETFDDVKAALTPEYGHWVIFEHCLPFNITRAYDEAKGLDHPRIWTDKRDQEMWAALQG